MGSIIQLSDHIISRISAGEVIERPVYAVKELIENSLDAGADSVAVHIEDAGLKKIIVKDNGVGMSKDDLLESFKPHTTSKVVDESLIGIKTLGFRGEALASIASISDLIIQSRVEKDPGGYQIHVKNGELIDVSPAGIPEGTIVTVQNLFQAVPARKKFLKSNRTEFRHIVNLLTQYALTYPNIKFQLSHNKRMIFDLPKNQNILARTEKLLGSTISSQLLPIVSEPSYVTVSGFIARPQTTSTTQQRQFIFVNGRSVNDKLISQAVRDSFGNLLDATVYPLFIINLVLPFESVDINIHPRKEQVSFANTSLVYDEVHKAVRDTLLEHNLTFSASGFSQSPRTGTTTSYSAQSLRANVTAWSVRDALQESSVHQLHKLYLLLQTDKGILLVDQHAAHERILYEQYKEEFLRQKKSRTSYRLPKPIIIDLPFTDAIGVSEHLLSLQSLGFEIENYSDQAYRVNAVPEILKDRDIQSLIIELVEQLDNQKKEEIDHISNVMLSFLACRSAVMKGEMLTEAEGKKLLEKLESTPHNATCPHGRPTKIEISLSDLHKMFKRE